MHTIRQMLQPIRKSLLLRPASPESRRLRHAAANRRGPSPVVGWLPVPVPAYATSSIAGRRLL